jgi:uncharacterized protein YdeI (YjbR/CyaY-like superfamily)
VGWSRRFILFHGKRHPDDMAEPEVSSLLALRAMRIGMPALDGANRYAILYRVQTAKKPETRAERIARFVAMCERHETLHPQRRR